MNLANINLNLLVTLDVLLEERNVTRAGRRLGLSQPATSAALKQLRLLFDDPLLIAGRPEMKPTPRADALRAPLRHALGQFSSLFADASDFDPAHAKAEVRICATDYVPFTMGPMLTACIAEEAPGVRLRIGTARGYDVHQAMAEGAFDLAIGVLGFAPGFRWEELFQDEGACALRRDHPACARAEAGVIQAEDFRRYPQVHVAVYRRTGSLVADATAGTPVPDAQFTVGSHLAALFMVGESDALAIGSRRMAERLAPALGLEVLAVPGAARAIPVVMMWHQSRDASPLMRWLRGRILSMAKALRDDGSSHA